MAQAPDELDKGEESNSTLVETPFTMTVHDSDRTGHLFHTWVNSGWQGLGKGGSLKVDM